MSRVSAVTSHVSAVTSRVSAVASGMSAVTSRVSRVACLLSHVGCRVSAVTSGVPVAALCERMRCHDAAQLARLAPLLQQKVGDAARALADCARVTDTAQQW